MGDKFEPSKDYGATIIHRGSKLGADDEIFLIFSNKFVNNVLLCYTKKNEESGKALLKSIELPRKNLKKLQLLTLTLKMKMKMM